jgi:hypothetical protein
VECTITAPTCTTSKEKEGERERERERKRENNIDIIDIIGKKNHFYGVT